jgi:transposase InsO family protein
VVILDLCSRGVVELTVDKTIAGELTRKALMQAILERNLDKGLVCHFDRGSQYAVNNYKVILVEHGFVGSMSRKGDFWDNAVAESFFTY